MTWFWLVQMTYITFELRIATLALARFKLTRLFMQAIHSGKFSMPMTNYVNMVLGYNVCICSFSLILCWGLQRRVPLESIAIVNVLVSPGNQITGAIWDVCNAVMQPMESQFYLYILPYWLKFVTVLQHLVASVDIIQLVLIRFTVGSWLSG